VDLSIIKESILTKHNFELSKINDENHFDFLEIFRDEVKDFLTLIPKID